MHDILRKYKWIDYYNNYDCNSEEEEPRDEEICDNDKGKKKLEDYLILVDGSLLILIKIEEKMWSVRYL
jgi:hypothetical protein